MTRLGTCRNSSQHLVSREARSRQESASLRGPDARQVTPSPASPRRFLGGEPRARCGWARGSGAVSGARARVAGSRGWERARGAPRAALPAFWYLESWKLGVGTLGAGWDQIPEDWRRPPRTLERGPGFQAEGREERVPGAPVGRKMGVEAAVCVERLPRAPVGGREGEKEGGVDPGMWSREQKWKQISHLRLLGGLGSSFCLG